MLKRSRILTTVAAMAGAAALAAPASALILDTNGGAAGGVRNFVETFDWLPASAYAEEGNAAVLDFINSNGATVTPFQTYIHAELGSMTDSNGNVLFVPGDTQGGAARQEFTVTGVFTEVVTAAVNIPGVISLASFSVAPVAGDVLEIWYDDGSNAGAVAADALSGDGYNDGRLILRAEITAGTSTFGLTDNFVNIPGNTGGPTTSPPLTIGPDGLFDVGDLDQAGTDNYSNTDTMVGNGVTSLFATVIDFDPTFFLADPGEIFFDILTTTQVLPFGSVNPSDAFDTTASGLVSGSDTVGLQGETSFAIGAGLVGIGIGAVNGHSDLVAIPGVFTPGVDGALPPFASFGLGGPDIIFQTDASNDFTGPDGIPEPITAGLGLMGLSSLALAARRRR